MEVDAIAVYMYDMTHHVESLFNLNEVADPKGHDKIDSHMT